MAENFILMGVSGCGKTTIGQAVAKICGVNFVDGDTLHTSANIQKMASGRPLTDEDRAPWLADVGRVFTARSAPTIVGCSALKRLYRNWISEQAGSPVHFLHLFAEQPVLAKRVADRPGHFMPPALLDSQFATLEHLQSDEQGRVFKIDRPFEAVVNDVAAYVRDVV